MRVGAQNSGWASGALRGGGGCSQNAEIKEKWVKYMKVFDEDKVEQDDNLVRVWPNLHHMFNVTFFNIKMLLLLFYLHV